METKQTIRQRETIRHFRSGITNEQLTPLLEAGIWAPNHGKREPWRFIVFNNTAAYNELIHAYQESGATIPYFEKMLAAERFPTMVVVVMPRDPEPKKYREDLLAHGSLIQNIQLAAWEEGIGVVWKTNFMRPSVATHFGIQENEEVTGFLLLGTFTPKAQDLNRERQPLSEKVTMVAE